MKQQSVLDRYLYFGRKKIAVTLRGLTASAVKGRFAGPRVLMNSFPKAGTNMLERALERFPLLRNAGKRTLRGWEGIDSSTAQHIRGIKRGQFWSAHLPSHPEVLSIVKEEGIKVLFMIRDPRDIAVSFVKYVTSIDLTHRAHEYFISLHDDDERLMAIIKGVDNVVSPLSEALSKFEGWLEKDRALVVRFEDLVGEKGGGAQDTQRSCVAAIADHLDIAMTNESLDHICENIYSTKTLTFRKGRRGGWREMFKPRHVAAFKERAGDVLVKYGYDNDDDWN